MENPGDAKEDILDLLASRRNNTPSWNSSRFRRKGTIPRHLANSRLVSALHEDSEEHQTPSSISHGSSSPNFTSYSERTVEVRLKKSNLLHKMPNLTHLDFKAFAPDELVKLEPQIATRAIGTCTTVKMLIMYNCYFLSSLEVPALAMSISRIT